MSDLLLNNLVALPPRYDSPAPVSKSTGPSESSSFDWNLDYYSPPSFEPDAEKRTPTARSAAPSAPTRPLDRRPSRDDSAPTPVADPRPLPSKGDEGISAAAGDDKSGDNRPVDTTAEPTPQCSKKSTKRRDAPPARNAFAGNEVPATDQDEHRNPETVLAADNTAAVAAAAVIAVSPLVAARPATIESGDAAPQVSAIPVALPAAAATKPEPSNPQAESSPQISAALLQKALVEETTTFQAAPVAPPAAGVAIEPLLPVAPKAPTPEMVTAGVPEATRPVVRQAVSRAVAPSGTSTLTVSLASSAVAIAAAASATSPLGPPTIDRKTSADKSQPASTSPTAKSMADRPAIDPPTPLSAPAAAVVPTAADTVTTIVAPNLPLPATSDRSEVASGTTNRPEPAVANDAPTGRTPNERSHPTSAMPPGEFREVLSRLGPAQSSSDLSGRPLNDVERMRLVQRVARAFQNVDEEGGTLRLRLSPPELGALQLEVTVRNGVLDARLSAETPQAQALLLDNVAALRDRLADQGVRLGQFDVDLQQQPRGGQGGLAQHSPDGQRGAGYTGSSFGRERRFEESPAAIAVGAPVARPGMEGELDVTI